MKKPIIMGMLWMILIGNHISLVSAQAEEHHHHETPESSLKLNDGQKWQVDKHTDQSIQTMESTFKKFQGVSKHNPAEYQSLGKELEEQLKTLVAGCTMIGDAHTQLHLFIARLNPLVEELNTGMNVQAFEKIGKELEAFHHFFEYLPKG